MDLVARRGRCSKATLYRQWRSKPQLVAAALRGAGAVAATHSSTGSLRDDLVLVADSLTHDALEQTALLPALHHASLKEADLADAVRVALVEPWERRLSSIVADAVERGELAQEPAATAFLPQLLISAVLARPLVDDPRTDSAYLAHFIDTVVLPAMRHS